MATSQFVPFGLAPGPGYVQDPATWAANPIRQSAFPPGILLKENINTPLRQASSVATMVAAFIATYQAADVLDDGDLVTLRDQFVAALQALIGSSAGASAYWDKNNPATTGGGVVNWANGLAASVGLGYAAGVITIDKTGLYLVNAAATLGYLGGAGGSQGSLQFHKNGAAISTPNIWAENNNTVELGGVGLTAVMPLAAGDTLSVFFTRTAGICQLFGGAGQFTGVKIA